jgi:hypothetical protein
MPFVGDLDSVLVAVNEIVERMNFWTTVLFVAEHTSVTFKLGARPKRSSSKKVVDLKTLHLRLCVVSASTAQCPKQLGFPL